MAVHYSAKEKDPLHDVLSEYFVTFNLSAAEFFSLRLSAINHALEGEEEARASYLRSQCMHASRPGLFPLLTTSHTNPDRRT